jgi:molybdenum cofactor synthesis domain-containing protein
MIRFAVLTISDKGSRGEREDKSGRVIMERMKELPETELVHYEVIPDDTGRIQEKLKSYADAAKLDLVLTTGGTGFSPRDITPEATRPLLHQEVPGIPEAMRLEGFKKTKAAMLSRGVAGIRHKTLIINLPGSSRGAAESLDVILSELPHAIWAMTGADHSTKPAHPGRP